MAGLNEIAKWEREVYQIEEDDPVLGGVKGVTNKPLKHLANRTLYLKQVLEAAGQKLMPKKLTATTRNIADSTGHTHEIDLASTTTKGLVQLTNDTGLDSESLALTAKAGKAIAQSVAQLQLSTTNALNQKVNKTDISNAVNSTSQTTVASSQAVKTAYDLANSKYTAQDASPTQKGLVQLANNLTTNDATKALTAAQGKILKDEIDRIEIGGRNLIKNSRLLNDTTHWNVIGGRDVRNGIAVLKSLDTSRQWCWRQTFDLPEKQYTFSAEVKPERTAFYLHLQNGKSWVNFHARNLTPGIWQKISITFVSAIRNISFINPGEGLIELQNPMLVEGNRAMTWAPAPEDLTEEALNSARQNYVAKTGDTMTGPLNINHANSYLRGKNNGVDDWFVGRVRNNDNDVALVSYQYNTGIHLKSDRVESNKPIYRGNHLVFDEGNLLPVRQIDLRSIANGQISFQDATPAQLPLGAFVGLSKKSHLNGAGDGWMMINKGWPDNSGVFACNRIGISGDRIRFQTANNLNAWGNTIELANLSDFIYQKIGNFEIRKYPDGMMIQTYFYDVNDLKEWGEKQFTWAVAFADKPMVIPKVEHTYGINSDVGSAIMRKSTNAVCYYKLYEHNSENQGDCRVQFLGIGRWK
ncbi:tail fiber protein [Glaesserella parasuis]|uniref:tail fiber protein n=4 Tax=Glaesserella parasuis TaxID=738 RepID=UPI00271F375E|nr:tail fiber protein [Glaesserella parasuis]MDO9657249.1 tail fiber protein [Glaesserella parasuis]MDO9759822.1 tail fiber protein [Glaesserella parasuis]MDO9792962.1 tail fiber protein [Glaesserella parasuis]MDO9962545.1 tail fiber protein [Glaesserella parasuis]